MIVQQVVYKMSELVYLKACDFWTIITIVYNFTYFGYDCVAGCLQNVGACLFESMWLMNNNNHSFNNNNHSTLLTLGMIVQQVI